MERHESSASNVPARIERRQPYRRWHRAAWPRLLVEVTHRRLTLLFFLFIAVYSVTVLLDPFTHFGLNDILIPFGSAYRTIWLGLGVLAAELALAIALSVFVRRWIGYRMWHALHVLTFILFPLSLLHGLGTGSDTTTPWATIMYGGSVLAVGAMVLWRTSRHGAVRPWMLAGMVVATVALVAWAAGGPDAPGWSVAAGTPQAPGEGVWLPAGQPVAGQVAMARTFVLPDPQRPYARIDLVWINPHLTRLHLAAGTEYQSLAPSGQVTGEVPLAARSRLLAAFNGGFHRLSNQYGSVGFRVADQWFALPTPGMATLAIAPSGQVTLGAWGSAVPTVPLPSDLRQNLPLILDHGDISARIDDGTAWGTPVNNSVRVWRSGLGQTADGALLYAAGTPLTARGLAEALQAAGAQRAMELDINSYWVTFNFFSPTGPNAASVRGEKLMAAMTRPATRYLTPDSRDFFYLTAAG